MQHLSILIEAVPLRFKVLVTGILIIEDPTVNVKCRTAIKGCSFTLICVEV